MKIWLINVGEPVPGDPGHVRLLRTGILADHLARRGHEVTWFNANVDHQRKVLRNHKTTIFTTPQGYRLVLLSGRLYQKNVSFKRILSHRENAHAFKEMAQQFDVPDVIMSGLPTIELALAASRFAKAKNVPFIVDFRDMWPDIFQEQSPKVLRPFMSLALAPWENNVRECVLDATSITGITDAFVDWGLSKAGRQPTQMDRAFHLAVNPSLPDAENREDAKAFWMSQGVTKTPGHVIASFMGTLSERMAISTLIAGYQRLNENEKAHLKLVFCGKGGMEQTLKSLASDEPGILFAGWRDGAELYELKAMSDCGLLPYKSTPDFQRSYPNKVGEYLQAGLPIMTSVKGVTRDLVSDNKIGWTYDEDSPQDAARALRDLLNSSPQPIDSRQRCLQIYADMFDGHVIYKNMADHVEEVARRGR